MSNQFGTFLRSYRMGVGYRLREFARDLGISPSTLSAIELGQRKCPKSFDWNKAARLLGLKDGSTDAELFFMFKRASGIDPNLVDAAKDMLEALEYVEVTLRLWNRHDGLAYKMVQAAILKAKGEFNL